ncbi:oligosaccharide flippase family protein [Lichenifustis flavocetrariae]|uniref:Oligosaccharide flippase family protein n=1 Tax=Lichenifustis flavocetrariae TaxID=2949735 RepID=A0AA41YYE6_9HYPH|nr:oligosaccharide flippase family protein [Lichenifustis flavocetrariae]MCW6509566.1 oligosaccharide flippase family protein [Lichenifustis flavocetrariae]
MLRRPGSSLILAVSSICNVLFPLIRGVCLAHLLTPAEFGLAVTVTIVSGIAELVTDLGIGQMAIKSGDSKSLATLHSIAVIRGALLGCMIALGGPLFAWVFHSPGTAWIYAVVGLASFIRSFMHLDIKVQMRGYSYLADAVATIGSQTIWSVVTIIGAMILHDYRAMAFGLIAFALGYVGLTHMMSPGPWRMGWDKDVVRESIKYGRPLVLNGIVYSVLSLGDRTLAGARISLDQLAHYTALTTSAFQPRAAISGFLNSLFIPHFVNARTPADQRQVTDLWFIIISLLTGIFGFGYLGLGQLFTAVVFGKAYHIDQTIVSLVGILGSIRYLTCLPSPPALAYGRGSLLLQFTLMSIVGLGIGGILVLYYPGLTFLVLGMSIGETIALFWVVHRLLRFLPATPAVAWCSVLIPLALLVSMAILLYFDEAASLMLKFTLCFVGACLHVTACMLVLRHSGSGLKDVLRVLFPGKSSPTLSAAIASGPP